MRPHRRRPTRLPRPWDSPGKNTGVGCHFLLQCMKVKSLSCIRPLVTPWIAAYQAPLSMGFSRQEYWSGVPLPSPQNLSGINLYHRSVLMLPPQGAGFEVPASARQPLSDRPLPNDRSCQALSGLTHLVVCHCPQVSIRLWEALFLL